MATRKTRRPVEDESTNGRTRKGQTVKIDMTDASTGGAQRYPEGDYKVKIVKAKSEVNENSGNTQVVLDMEIVLPEKFEGKQVRDYLTLTRKAAFRVGMVLDAVHIKWSQKVIELPLGKLLGKSLGVTLYDDTYNGRTRSKVADYLDEATIDGILEGGDDDEEEEEELDDEASEEAEDDDDDEDLDDEL